MVNLRGCFRKKTLIPVLLIVVMIGSWVILELFAESQGINRAFFYFVVTGNGEGKTAGYFGWKKSAPDRGDPFYSHVYAKVLPSADIQNIALLANASGYETILITKPPNYSALPPSVAIKNHVILYPNNVQVNFTLIVLENGYLTVSVRSDYFLQDGWMRSVFQRMFLDINMPSDTISRFDLAVNWIATTD
jgi:hypothetical protein